MRNNNILRDKSFSFALRIIKLHQYLSQEKKEYVLSKQILKSGTSIGANIEEADAAQSKKDFIAKLSISYKESRETRYWIRLLKESSIIDDKQFNSIMNDCDELIRILVKILKTCKSNQTK